MLEVVVEAVARSIHSGEAANDRGDRAGYRAAAGQACRREGRRARSHTRHARLHTLAVSELRALYRLRFLRRL